jgi:hypothetical protein
MSFKHEEITLLKHHSKNPHTASQRSKGSQPASHKNKENR